MQITLILLWAAQLYLVFFFLRSAYRKTVNFERVSAEFARWGYPYPGLITRFLSLVWVVCSVFLLIPATAIYSALALLGFMITAFATLWVHGEYRRLIEPAVPIMLLVFIVIIRFNEVTQSIEWMW